MTTSTWLLIMWAAFFYVPCAVVAVYEWHQAMRTPVPPTRTGVER